MSYTATLESVHQVTPRVKQFRLRVGGHTFEHDPGQHTTVQFERDGEEVVRPYTPTSLPGTDRLTLAIKRYDDGTASVWMHERERGDEIELGDLDGNLRLRNPDDDVAFVSTGTGITPMMAMVKEYLQVGEGDAQFFFGEKSREDLIYRETLDQLAAQNDELSVTYVLSEEEWGGPTGHVQDHLADELDGLTGRDFYVCGVPEMVVETTDRLREEGVGDERIFTEGWEEDEVADEG